MCSIVALAAFLIPNFFVYHQDMSIQGFFARRAVLALLAEEVPDLIMNGFDMFLHNWPVCCLEVTQFTRVFLNIVVDSLNVMLQCRLARRLVVTLWTRKFVVNLLHMALHNLLGPDSVIHCAGF